MIPYEERIEDLTDDLISDLTSVECKLKTYVKENMHNACANICNYLGPSTHVGTYVNKGYMIENYEAQIENVNAGLELIKNIDNFINEYL